MVDRFTLLVLLVGDRFTLLLWLDWLVRVLTDDLTSRCFLVLLCVSVRTGDLLELAALFVELRALIDEVLEAAGFALEVSTVIVARDLVAAGDGRL